MHLQFNTAMYQWCLRIWYFISHQEYSCILFRSSYNFPWLFVGLKVGKAQCTSPVPVHTFSRIHKLHKPRPVQISPPLPTWSDINDLSQTNKVRKTLLNMIFSLEASLIIWESNLKGTLDSALAVLSLFFRDSIQRGIRIQLTKVAGIFMKSCCFHHSLTNT